MWSDLKNSTPYQTDLNQTTCSFSSFANVTPLIDFGELSHTISELNLSWLNQSSDIVQPWEISNIREPLFMVIILSILCGAVFVSAVAGNVSVLCVICRDRRFHSPTYYLMANLALADLIMAIACQPANLAIVIFNGWRFGAFMCKAVPYLQGVSVCASVNTLVVIAIDRYVAICHVMRQRNTKRLAKIILLLIWLVALLLMTPWALYYQVSDFNNTNQIIEVCYAIYPDPAEVYHKAFFLGVIFLMCYALPLTFIVACYSMIGYRVWHRDAPGITSSRGIIEKSKIRVIKMLVVVVLLFMFSWMPLYILEIKKLFFSSPSSETTQPTFVDIVVIPFAQWLGTSNSCMNPLVYCFFSQKIRSRIFSLLCCRKPRNASWYSSRSNNSEANDCGGPGRETLVKVKAHTNGHSRYGHYYISKSLYDSRCSRLEEKMFSDQRNTSFQSTLV